MPSDPFGFVPPKFEGEISNYTPSLRDQAAYWLARNWYGDDREGVQKARRLTDVAEYSPFGFATMADDVTRATGRGDYLGAGTALAMAGMPGPTPKGIKAYHGSPHSFDKFSLDKIGTGEGAQAYGHGLYFAENEGVAKSYRDALANGMISVDGKKVQRGLDGSQAVWDMPDLPEKVRFEVGWHLNRNYTLEDALKSLEKSPKDHAALKKAIDDGRLAEIADPGSMYEVNINADPEQFLDWDKPLSEQPHIAGKFSGANPNQPGADFYADMDNQKNRLNTLNRIIDGGGAQADAAMREKDEILKMGEAGASKALHAKGIPGIKYLDQGSRAKGDGSRNYVVFDDSLIEILRKYGIVLPFAGAAASSLPFGFSSQEQQ